MKTQLPFGVVEQLAQDVFEITPNAGVELNADIAKVLIEYYQARSNHPKVLVNRTNEYDTSLEFMQTMTSVPLLKAVAVYVPSYQQALVAETQKFLFKIPFERFLDRDEALNWLQQQ